MLSEEEKKKIEEEEKLRAEIKNKYNQPPRKKTSRGTLLGLIFVGLVVIIMAVAYNQPSHSTPPVPVPHLQARVSTTADYLNIYNDSQVKWTGCKVRLNNDYKATVYVVPGKNAFSYDDITKDGQRFNYYTTKPTSFYMSCQNPAQDYSAEW